MRRCPNRGRPSICRSTSPMTRPIELLGNRIVGALGALGQRDGASTAFALPPGTAAGSYYVIAVADAGGAVAESLENNNTRTSAVVRVGPDFTVTAAHRTVVCRRRNQHQRQRHHEESGSRSGAGVGDAASICRPTRRFDAGDLFLGCPRRVVPRARAERGGVGDAADSGLHARGQLLHHRQERRLRRDCGGAGDQQHQAPGASRSPRPSP